MIGEPSPPQGMPSPPRFARPLSQYWEKGIGGAGAPPLGLVVGPDAFPVGLPFSQNWERGLGGEGFSMERPDKTTPRVRGTTERVDLAARALRHRETPAERLLWAALRSRRLDGLKFRRQHPVGPFVLDFYCPERKLVVELEGAVHGGPEATEQDAFRSAYLTQYGYRVLRFRNDDVLGNLPMVLEHIATTALTSHPAQNEHDPLTQGPPPLPALGEGVGG